MTIISWIMIIIFTILSYLGLNFAQTTDVPLPPPAIEGAADYVQISYGLEDGTFRSISAYDDWDGHLRVEFEGEVKKIGNFDLSLMGEITEAVEQSGLREMNGRYESGEDYSMNYASFYITYKDGSTIDASFNGTIPDEYYEAYSKMEAYFIELTADLPVYVPEPLVEGEVDLTVQDEIMAIISASGISNPDAYLIRHVEMDENFGYNMGLTNADGIVDATTFAAMMMTDPFSIAIAKLDPSADAAAVAKDFSDNVDFYKWVCVLADKALVAQKGDLVLCMVSSDFTYEIFADAIASCGWTELNTSHR